MFLMLPLNRHKTLPSAAITAIFVLAGCSARKPIAPAYAQFRLESVKGDSVLLTPPIPEGKNESAIVKLALKTSPAPSGVHCSAERGHFRVEQANDDPSSVHITLPALAIWLGDLEGGFGSDGNDEIAALFALLADLDKLQEAGCFPETKLSIRDFILQSLPMKPTDSLFNYYGYLADHSGLNLKPGMRLKVEHAYFRPAEPGEKEHTAKLFLGVSTAYFNLQLTSDGRIRFRHNETVKYTPPSLVHGIHDEISDPAISSIPQERYFRLLFKTYLVPQEHTRSTAIIGATKSTQLDELDKELRAHPEKDCKNTAATYGAVCFGFEGFVTLTPQVRVELNGKSKFIDSGTRIKDLLSRSQADVLKSLKIQRQFLNSYYDLRFDPADPNVLLLALVARDRVTWSNSSRALH
jgi:hypothetical protein